MTSPYLEKPLRSIKQAKQDLLSDPTPQDLPDKVIEPPRLNIIKAIMLKFRGRPIG